MRKPIVFLRECWILRGTMRKIADGETYKMPATIDDPVILDEITDVLKARGFPR